MFTKWLINIKALKNYRFDENGQLWRMPYIDKNKKHRDWRKINMQYPNRWKVGKQYYSKTQLKPHLSIDNERIKIYETDNLPF
jgi:hypothetical protein